MAFTAGKIAAQSPISTIDQYFKNIGDNKSLIKDLFADHALLSTVNYDSAGQSFEKTISIELYINELSTLNQDYFVTQSPVVLIKRNYGPIASYYCSVWMQFVDRATHDTLIARSMQSLRLVNQNNKWKIAHIQLQMEHPSYPLANSFWPDQLTSALTETSKLGKLNDSDFYDEFRIYKPEEVEEPPVYPGTSESLPKLMEQFNVVDSPSIGYSPFIVVIAEDGGPEITYAENLSGFQLTRAQSFVRSMMIWYPAVKSAASVKCKLIFYIHE